MAVKCLILLLAIFTVGSYGELVENDRIVGGKPIEIEEAPHHVQIMFRVGNDILGMCGGSIIAKNVILTAAHCVNKKEDVKVKVGTKYYEKEGKVYDVVDRKVHEDYKGRLNDIALLWLSEDLEYNKNVASIALPTPENVIADGTNCRVTGWGATLEGSSGSEVLLQTSVPIVNHKECKEAFAKINRTISDDMICAGYMEEGGKDACQGDSGGPLVANEKQWGIVSWGEGCARPMFPGVYASVTYFRKWIDKYVIFD